MTCRRLSFCIALVALVLGFAHISNAQESRPVPAYGDYMDWCVKGAQPKGGYGSAVDRAFEEANCHCIYEKLPKGTMSKEQFFNAGATCQKEKARSPVAFTEKYYSRIVREPAATGVSRADATFKYGSGSIFLGPDCKASSIQYGRGTWGWANGGIMVNLEKKKDIGFARAESPYQDGRCPL